MDNVAVMMRLLVWGAVLTALVAGWAPAQTAAAVAVDGTVNDGAGLAVAGAIVTLETAAGAEQRTTTTDQAGAFHFGDVAAGSYNVTVAAGGFAVWTANVTFGVLNQAPVAAVLRVAPVTSTIEVTLPPKELAAEQLKSEVKQRLLGIFPHFLVTYEPNAAPLTAGQKFHLGFKTLVDPVTLLGTGIDAGIQQAQNKYPEFGQGVEGYAKRFGARYTSHISGAGHENGVAPPSLLPARVFNPPRRLPASAQEPALGRVSLEESPFQESKARECGVHWRQLILSAAVFNAFQNTGNLYTSYWYRWETTHGKWWDRYVNSVEAWRWNRWKDDNPFLDDYVGHPMMGAITNNIWIQNDPKGMTLEQSNTRQYWRRMFRAFLFSTFYSFEWKLGPAGEAGIGHSGDHFYGDPGVNSTNETGWVELVTTPVGGMLWTLAEDALDKHVIRRLENKSRNPFALLGMMFLNPARSTANIFRIGRASCRERV